MFADAYFQSRLVQSVKACQYLGRGTTPVWIAFEFMSYSDSIDIECTLDEAFAIISDLPAMGRLSPENDGGRWLEPSTGPRVGAKFEGANTRAGDQWSTIAKVKVYDPPNRFMFDIAWHHIPIARWEYTIEVAPGGCRVTETWTDKRNALFRKQGDTNGFVRAEFTKDSIRQTLAKLKDQCESSNQGQ
jgi:Polyketide cyclase / dehydrase and lipid transport